MMVHSICCDPANADRFYVGIAAAGTFLPKMVLITGRPSTTGCPPLYSVPGMQY